MITPAKPNPIKMSELIREAAMITALSAHYLDNEQFLQLADAITDCYRSGDNGYELAKKIEQKTAAYSFAINVDVVCTLDFMDTRVRQLYHQAYHQWSVETGQTPPLPFGTLFQKGRIVGISESYDAAYLVSKNPYYYQGPTILVKFNDDTLQELNHD